MKKSTLAMVGICALFTVSYFAFAMGRGAPAPVNLEKFNGYYALESTSDQYACPAEIRILANTEDESVLITPDWLGEKQEPMVVGAQYCEDDPIQSFTHDCDSIVLNSEGNSLIRVFTQEQNPLNIVTTTPPQVTLTESYTLEDSNRLRVITKNYRECYYDLKGAN